uniref:XK-related protein n=1 Tax=Ciona intestinalis TaxID=7719 RepID=P91583_CIOIN|nr:COS41.5 [Ciona intestinalis]
MYAELSDVSMLRLFECFLESAPQLVLQLYIMIRVEEGDHILTGVSACFSLLSLSWAMVAYTKALRAAASQRKKVSWPGIFLQTMWRCGMVVGRVVAIVLFATVFQEWTLLILGLHWFLMTAWLVAQKTDFCNTWYEERLFNAVIGIIYVFCFFNMKEGRSRCRAAFYYTVSTFTCLHNLCSNILQSYVPNFLNEEKAWVGLPPLPPQVWCLYMCIYFNLHIHTPNIHTCLVIVNLYLQAMLAENSLMIMLWWPHRVPGTWYNIPALVAVWGGFLVGSVSMSMYYQFFHPASRYSCHCCNAWHKLAYRCYYACCCGEVPSPTYIAGSTPYKKGRDTSGSNEFETTVSSEEELDCRDFTDLRCSYETPTTFPGDHSGIEPQKNHCTKHLVNKNHVHGLKDTTEGQSVSVIGNARVGFKVSAIPPNVFANKKIRKSLDIDQLQMPKPKATSTPGDLIENDPKRHKRIVPGYPPVKERSEDSSWSSAVEEQAPDVGEDTPRTKLSKICETPKRHRPGSPNTLVRNWVKKTQNMYEKKEGCFSDSAVAEALQDDPEDAQKGNDSGEHGASRPMLPERKKSQKEKKSVVLRRKKNKRAKQDKLRNSFREAFGFNVIDVDQVGMLDEEENGEKVRKTQPRSWKETELFESYEKQEKKQKTRRNKKTCPNKIKFRRDEPPDVEAKLPGPDKKKVNNFPEVEHDFPFYDEGTHSDGGASEVQNAVCPKEVSPYDNVDETHQEVHEEMMPTASEGKTYREPFTMDRVEYLHKHGRMGLSTAKDSPARKKLAFKQRLNRHKKTAKLEKSMEALGRSMEGVLETEENYRIHLSPKAQSSHRKREVLRSLEN